MSDDREVTMVLHNYARRAQLDYVITGLLEQKTRPVIFVWNNDVNSVFRDDRVDWIVNSSRNNHVRSVISMWQMAWTPWVARMDDDLYLGDDEVLTDALTVAKSMRHSTQILGAYGVKLWINETYQTSHHLSMPKGHGQIKDNGKPNPEIRNFEVDIVKGRFMLFRQSASHQMTPGFGHVHTDVHISTSLAGRRRFHHMVSGVFWERTHATDPDQCKPRLVEFPLDDKGYCERAEHTAERDALTSAWVSQCVHDRRAKKRPAKLQRDANTKATTQKEEET